MTGQEKNDSAEISENGSRGSSKTARLLLAIILLIAFALQVYGVDRMESNTDDRLLMESALLLVEGYHPYFDTRYALPSIWLWAASINAGWMLSHSPELWRLYRGGQKEDLLRMLDRSRWSAYLFPNKVINRLRWVNALAAVFIVLLSYLIAFKLCGFRWAGLSAAAICAVSPLLVMYGTNFNPDQFQTLFGAGCVYFCITEAEGKGDYQWLVAAIFLGAAFSSRITSALLWIPLVLAILMRQDTSIRAGFRRIAAATLVMMVAHIILCPHFLADFALTVKKMFTATVFYNSAPGADIRFKSGMRVLRGLLYGLGYGSAGLASVGIAWGVKRRNKSTLILLAAIVPNLLFFFIVTRSFERYAFLFMPMMAAFAGAALVLITKKAPTAFSPVVAALLFVGALPVTETIQIVQTRLNGDTRTITRRWIYENIPPGSRIFVNFFGPNLHYDKASIRRWRAHYAKLLTRDRAEMYTLYLPADKMPVRDVPSPERATEFPTEFFRDTLMHEERYQYKRFAYLDAVDSLPAPGYDYIDICAFPNDPAIIAGTDRYWVVARWDYFKNHRRLPAGLNRELATQAWRHGKEVMRFSNRGKMGHELLIYEVNPINR